MSLNQTRADKSDAQIRKPGRNLGSSGHQPRSSYPSKGGGSLGTAPPNSSSSSSSSSRGFKKSNGQGGQYRGNPTSGNPDSGIARVVPNGAHVQSQQLGPTLPGAPDTGASKSSDPVVPRPGRPLPRAPTSQSSTPTPEPQTPTKPTGDMTRTFPLQFGTLSPSNWMQIPARTSSAPPNLDEQKRDQARHESARAAPPIPIASAPKQQQQQQPRRDPMVTQTSSGEPRPPVQIKKDNQSHVPSVTQKSSVLPISGLSMPHHFQQPQLPVQFNVPSSQIQSQAIATNALPVPLQLQVGNAPPVQQQVFVSGLQTHHLQPPQGMMHQGQSLGFSPQMASQLGTAIGGNLGMGMTSQFAQTQPNKFVAPRKAVKITHPDTHEELRLDKRSDSFPEVASSGPTQQLGRGHANVPPPSQALPSFASAHSMSYYQAMQPGSYTPSIFYPAQTTHQLTGTQINPGSSAPRYNFSSGQTVSFMNPSLNPLAMSKSGPTVHGASEQVETLAHEVSTLSISAPLVVPSVNVTVRPAKDKGVTSSVPTSTPGSHSSTPVSQSTDPISHSSAPVSQSLPPSNVSALHKEPNKQSWKVEESGSSHRQKGLDGALPNTSTTVSIPSSGASSLLGVGVKGASVLAQREPQNVSSPDLVAPFEEASSVVTVTEGRKREPLKRSDSSRDHQKKGNKKEQRYPQHQHQAHIEALESSGVLKSSALNKHTDTRLTETSSKPVTSEGVETLVTSTPSLPPPSLNPEANTVSEGDSQLEAKEDLGVSKGTLGSGKISQIDQAAARDELQDGKRGPDEPSMRSGLEGEGINSEDSGNVQSVKPEEIVSADCEQEEGVVALAKQMGSETIDRTQNGCPVSDSRPDICSNLENLSLTDQMQKNSDEPTVSAPRIGSNVDKEREESVPMPSGRELEEESFNLEASASSEVFSQSVDLEHGKGGSQTSIEAPISESSHIVCHVDVSDAIEIGDSNDATERDDRVLDPSRPSEGLASFPIPSSNEPVKKLEGRGVEGTSGVLISSSSLGSKDKPSEQSKAKNFGGRKKWRKDILSKADAAGSNSDLYTAYKPEEKQEAVPTSEIIEDSTCLETRQDDTEKEIPATEEDTQSKGELEDWEDAAEISSPKLKNGEHAHGSDESGGGLSSKKYSRDFLLTFSEVCKDLPVGFEILADIADALLTTQVPSIHTSDRESYAGSGRILDRPSPGSSRIERRTSGVVDDDRWTKAPIPFISGRDPRIDVGHGGPAASFRSQGGNVGVLRNPRGQLSPQYAGGILSGPMQSLAAHGLQRNSSDAERWQRTPGIQKGLMPAPHTALAHKAEKRYEVGKVTDEEEQKQRQLKGILNKLTPQNFEKLFEQVKEVNIDNAVTLKGVINQIFDKALMEPTFCEMYANFCFHLAGELPDFSEDNEKITFKRLLLNKCQEEFERGEREQAEANRVEEEGEAKLSDEEREEKRIQARRRMLGNIRLIGELYKKKMLTERIMHECIKKLLGQVHNPDEEDIEALCKLMSTIGEIIDHPKAKEHMDAYFDRMGMLSNNQKLSSRVRFMLKDSIDLRKNRWQQRRKVEGPKKIEEVHRDAAQERQAQTTRLARGPSLGSSTRRPQSSLDYGSRGIPGLASPGVAPMGGQRGMPLPQRTYGAQDVRFEDRHSFDRGPSVPLPQRPIDDDSITLGPQGGLARGMSIRGQQSLPSGSADAPGVDNRRMGFGSNGYSSFHSTPDWSPYGSAREETIPRNFVPDRNLPIPIHDQSNYHDRNTSAPIRDARIGDRQFDRPSSSGGGVGRAQSSTAVAQSIASESKVWSEERLRKMSISAIEEFYSANDEGEVASCIKDLNSPNFYPTMVSLWVGDSFERKDKERDLLAKLLTNLCKSQEGLLTEAHLIKGFEYVFSTLEDAIYDAPKAPVFLGQILVKVIRDHVVSLTQVGSLILRGGEEPGRLVQAGLASEILGNVLEILGTEKGSSLDDICRGSNLRLEDFLPPNSIKPGKLIDLILKKNIQCTP
ncbi:hypothetical protein AMTRI_Chr03g52090 [Amborella trichopoda]